MIVYFSMSKKKSRKEKIKTQLTSGKISYSYTQESYKKTANIFIANKDLELKKILLSTGIILLFNLLLYITLSFKIINLGFLGY